MALYPNQAFSEGDSWSPDLAFESFKAPYFDNQTQYLGHRVKMTDGEMSDDPGAIKARLAAITSGLLVSQTTGLTLAYTSGIVTLPDGGLQTVQSGLVAVEDNTTSYIWVNDLGQVQSGLVPPVRRVMMAKVVTVAGLVSSLQDLRAPSIYRVLPLTASIKSFGGSNSTDKVCTQNESFNQGYFYYRDFTVPAGVTIQVNKYARFFCSGNVRIAGNIVVAAANAGASSQAATINRSNALGGLRANGLGNNGTVSPWGAQPYGTGGNHGQMSSFASNPEAWAYTGDGGAGGGCLWVEAGGDIRVSGGIYVKGTNATLGGADPAFPGAGNPGIPNQQVYIGGAGGGSGGLILLSAVSTIVVEPSAVLDVAGGHGASGCNFMPASSVTNGGSFGAIGGAGGSGGYVILLAPGVNATGATINLLGGNTGNIQGNGTFSNSGEIWTFPKPYGIMGGGGGGGFGGSTGGFGISISGTQQVFTRINGGLGQLVVGNFVPIGA